MLVTGGMGYVGGRVACFLKSQGFQVIIGSREPIDQVSWLTDAKVQVIDWTSAQSLRHACSGQFAVVNLAGPDEFTSQSKYAEARRMREEGTQLLCSAAQLQGVKRFVHFSTAHVYKAPLVGEFNETMEPHPGHPYGELNLLAEQIVWEFRRAFEACVIFRLSNSFGAPVHGAIERWNLAINDFCRQAVSSGEIVLKSSGQGLRDFVTLTDAVRAVAHALTAPSDGLDQVLFNLGGQTESIHGMAQRVSRAMQEISGREVPIKRLPDDPSQSSVQLKYDCSRWAQTGFTWTSEFQKEIKDCLTFCQTLCKSTEQG